MKTNLSFANPVELQTECLVVVALDHGQVEKTEARVKTTKSEIKDAVADVIATREVTAKIFEPTLLHRPAKLKAKRLLLLGGGKAKDFSTFELRRLAGAAVRTLKARGIRSFAFVAPNNIAGEDAVKAIVEGAFVGNFDSDTYKSDRKDQKLDALTVVAHGDQASVQRAMNEAGIIGESQNFTRQFGDEPRNH